MSANEQERACVPHEEVAIPTTESKKKKTLAKIFKLQNFNFESDTKIAKLSGKKIPVARISRVDGGPVMISLSGGGVINPVFGVQASEAFGGYNLTMSISEEDYNALLTVHNQFVDYVVENREEFFPNSTKSSELIRELSSKTVQAPKPKKDGIGFWEPSLTVKVDNLDDLKVGPKGVRKLKIKNSETGVYEEDLLNLPGYRWTRLVLELKSIFIGSKSFSLSKRIKCLNVIPGDDDLEVASDDDDEDQEEEDEAPAKKQRVE